MISFIIGKIDSIEKNSVILNNNGIGYEIRVSDSTINKIISLGKNENLKLYTFMSVKEDSICLYGFLSLSQLKTFNQLIKVSGIGPKAAMNILSNMDEESVLLAIASEDINSLSKIPGIGKKTAQRLILELKDKINISSSDKNYVENDECADAIEALCSVGYQRAQILKIVMEMKTEGMKAQDIIKQVLKLFAK